MVATAKGGVTNFHYNPTQHFGGADANTVGMATARGVSVAIRSAENSGLRGLHSRAGLG